MMNYPTLFTGPLLLIIVLSFCTTFCDGFSLFGRSFHTHVIVPRDILANEGFSGQLQGRHLPAPTVSDVRLIELAKKPEQMTNYF